MRKLKIRNAVAAKVAAAIRRGELSRNHPCAECGSTEKIELHHPDYKKPLDVIPLCRSCHRKTHRGQKKDMRQIKKERAFLKNWDRIMAESIERDRLILGEV